MKKIILCLVSVLLIVGCSSKPNDVSDSVIQAAKKTIEIADSYLDYEISLQEAYDEIDGVYNRVKDVDSKEMDSIVTGRMFIVRSSFSKTLKKSETEILELRNSLAELIGEKAKK